MTNRGIALVLVTLSAAPACQLHDKPAEAPKPERVIVERGPLPPEEQPPAEAPAGAASASEPAEPAPSGIARTGAPTRGTLPKAIVQEKLESAQPGIRACYEAALATKPELRGVVDINFVVGTDGKVAHAEALEGAGALGDPLTIDCILGHIKKLEFPAPSGGRVFLSYPVQLEPPK